MMQTIRRSIFLAIALWYSIFICSLVIPPVDSFILPVLQKKGVAGGWTPRRLSGDDRLVHVLVQVGQDRVEGLSLEGVGSHVDEVLEDSIGPIDG